MRLRCFFGHDWEWCVFTYVKFIDGSKLPVTRGFRCRRCPKVKGAY